MYGLDEMIEGMDEDAERLRIQRWIFLVVGLILGSGITLLVLKLLEKI